MYLFERQSEKRDTENFPYTGSLPEWLQKPELGQAEGRSQELHVGLIHEWKGPKHLAHLLLLSQAPYRGSWIRRVAART